MNFSNATQRRQRRSLLGTHRVKRESLLPILSDSLFAINEETKNPADNVTDNNMHVFHVVEKTPSHLLPTMIPVLETSNDDPEMLNQLQREHNFNFIKKFSPTPKRLDIFPMETNDDSFITHETMITNDESILATTLIPQNESITIPNESLHAMDASNSDEIKVPAIVRVESNVISSKKMEFSEEDVDASDKTSISLIKRKIGKKIIAFRDESNVDLLKENISSEKDVCISNKSNNIFSKDTGPSESAAVNMFLKILDSKIETINKSILSDTQLVKDLQRKIADAEKEIEEIRNMKRVLMKHFKIQKKEGKLEY